MKRSMLLSVLLSGVISVISYAQLTDSVYYVHTADVATIIVSGDVFPKKICLYDCFEQVDKEYTISIPNGYITDIIYEGGRDRTYEYHYANETILYFTNHGEGSLNYNKLKRIIPEFGAKDNHSITGNILIPYGCKDVSKDVFDYGTVPHTIYYSGKDDNGYWADYQTPHINVGYINASSEQRELFDKVIMYVMENIPNKEVEVKL